MINIPGIISAGSVFFSGASTVRIKNTIHNVILSFRRNFRPLLIYHLYFSVLAVVVLVPASAWISTMLLTRAGLPLVGPRDMAGFFLSPAGIGWVLAAGSLGLLVFFIHHAGMIVIAARPSAGQYRRAISALWEVGRKIPDLLLLAVIQVGAHLAVAAPFLGVLGASWYFLLRDYDPYYLVSVQPSVFLMFLGICVPVALGMILCNGLIYLRWILAFPVLLLENGRPVAALKRSMALSRGHLRTLCVLVPGAALVLLLVPAILASVLELFGRFIMGRLPEVFAVLIPFVLLLLSAYILLAVLLSFFGAAVNSQLIFQLYREASGAPPVKQYGPAPARAGLYAWGLEAVLLIFAVGQAFFVLHSFYDFQDSVHISAHRGSSMNAPENTLPAIEMAIREGADYVEIDVRQTADGHLVLLHDRDLRRIAGKPRLIWEMSIDEVRRVGAGEWFHPRFRGVGIPTLEAAIEAVRGRAKLYLEIKPSIHTPDLTRNVVSVLRQKDFTRDVLIGALQPEVLEEVRHLEPELETALFVHTMIGEPDRSRIDALSLRAEIVTRGEIREAAGHGHELHVWTVNDRREMSRFIDMGVDNIITDRPDVLAGLLEERAELSDAALFLVKLRNWLRQ